MDLSAKHKEILGECAYDHVGLWSVIRTIDDNAYWEGLLPASVRSEVMQLIRDLLEHGLIEAGNFAPDREAQAGWLPISGSTDTVIAAIARAWDELDRTPNIGDVCWFTATPAGKKLAEELDLKGY